MEEATVAESLLDKIKPPRLEDAGLEDCALPPESIKEAFLKAASAVRSIVSTSDDEDEHDSGGRCLDDTWEDSTDALVGVKEGVNAPSEGCIAEKGGGLTEAPADEVSVGGGDPESKPVDVLDGPGMPGDAPACVEGSQGLEIGAKGKGILGKENEGDVAEDDEERKSKPTLVEGYV